MTDFFLAGLQIVHGTKIILRVLTSVIITSLWKQAFSLALKLKITISVFCMERGGCSLTMQYPTMVTPLAIHT